MQRLTRICILIVFTWISGLLAPSHQSAVLARPLAQTGDPVIIAAGDISNCSNQEDWQTASLLDSIEGTVLTLGDNAYEVGSLQEYNACYDPTWGRHKARTKPVPGNHEYGKGTADGYFAYFGDAATPLEPGCRQGCKGYYSFDVGAWHLIALNSEINNNPGSEQEQWLRADLAAHPTACTLAYWHRPRFSSGDHGGGAAPALYQALYDYGADVVLVGHDHDYERFGPQNPSGVGEPDRGIRQFVVGTGGALLRDFDFIQPNSEVRNSETFGVLKMTLHPTSYDWEFIPISGQTFRDSGSANCVTAGNLPAPPPTTVTTDPTPAPAAAAPAPAATAVANTATTQVPPAGLDYTIQRGDTLGTIGARYGLTWQQIAEANGLGAYSILEIGQVIRLPGVQGTASTTTGNTAVSNAPIPTPTVASPQAVTGTQTTTTSPTTPAAGRYVVQPGDTLWGIAVRNNTTSQALAAANGMSENDVLIAGRTLALPGQAATTQSVAAPAPLPTLATTAPITTSQSVSRTTALTTTAPSTVTAVATPATTATRVHTVTSGDTMISIATRYGLDWRQLLQLNGLTESSVLQVGQQIRLQ